MPLNIPPEAVKLAAEAWPGSLGAALSLRKLRGTAVARALAFAGGVALSITVAEPIALWLGAQPGTATTVVKVLLGYFAIDALDKGREALQAVDAAAIGRAITQRIRQLITPTAAKERRK